MKYRVIHIPTLKNVIFSTKLEKEFDSIEECNELIENGQSFDIFHINVIMWSDKLSGQYKMIHMTTNIFTIVEVEDV